MDREPVINARLRDEAIKSGFKALFSAKNIEGFASFVFHEKVKPALWNVARETAHFIIDAMFNRNGVNSGGYNGYRYTNYYTGPTFYSNQPPMYTQMKNGTYQYNNPYSSGPSYSRNPTVSPVRQGSIVCESDEDADALLEALTRHWENNGKLTVAILYEFAGLKAHIEPWMNNKGWSTVAALHKEHIRGVNGVPEVVIFYPPPYTI